MNIKSKIFSSLFAMVAAGVFLFGCADETVLQTPGNTSPNAGTVSHKNFNVLASDVSPAIYDPTTGTFTETEVTITATIGDRNNQALTDAHTVFFATEWGVIEPSCVTQNGTCSVTWKTSNFSFFPANDLGGRTLGSPGNTIVGFTLGEESFSDLNDNGVYDDPDGAFIDLDEPFIDIARDGAYTLGVDPIIDTVNGNDAAGTNGVHDIGDTFFNGPGCTHTSRCSTVVLSSVVWDTVTLKMDGSVEPEFPVGGTVSGLTGTLVLQNNAADNLSITANGTFTFATDLEDGTDYVVTVLTQPAGQTCTVTSGSGTIALAEVDDVVVTCADTQLTVGGNVTGTAFGGGTSITIQNNGADDIVIPDTGPFTFTFPAQADLTGYDVQESANTTGLTCTITGGGNNDGTGTLAGSNITNIDINCI